MKRQVVVDTINHKSLTEVPWGFELTSGSRKQLDELYPGKDPEVVLENYLYRGLYKKNVPLNDGSDNLTDYFGVHWHTSNDGGDVGYIVKYPVEDIKDIKNYTFPSYSKELADEVCDNLEKRQDSFTMFSIGMCYFERAWSLLRMENLLMNMILEPKLVHYTFDKILEHHMALLDYILDRDFDAVYLGDDWGQQMGTIMGPDKWKEFIKPGMQKIFDKIKSKGKYVVVHSCGDIRPLLPDLIDMGLDVYNTVQPEIYDLPTIKKEYGKDLTFYGGISTQQFLPYKKPEEVKESTLRILDFMTKDGGYILSPTHTVTPDIPLANVFAMIEAAKEFSSK